MKKAKMMHKTLSDGEILKRSLSQPWMFGVLVERYQKAFLLKSQAIVHSSDLAEDVVQETFLKIYKNTANFHETSKSDFNSWAYKILLNTSYTYYTRQKRESAYVSSMDYMEIDKINMSDIWADSDRHSIVKSILAKMPASVARLLQLYFIDGKSQKEIAFLENISHGTLRVRMYRARKYFLKYFKDHFKESKDIYDLMAI